MQLHDVWRISLQEFFSFPNVTLYFGFGRLVRIYMLVIEAEFHVCTCRKSWERGGAHGSASRSTSGKSIAACNSCGNGNRKTSTLLALTLLLPSLYSAFIANRLRHFMTRRTTRTAAP